MGTRSEIFLSKRCESRDQITNGSMLQSKAKRIFETLDGEKPFKSRLEYVEALAALAALHPEDMVRKVTGANQYDVSHVLWCSCSPTRLEWLWNNIDGDTTSVLSLVLQGMMYTTDELVTVPTNQPPKEPLT